MVELLIPHLCSTIFALHGGAKTFADARRAEVVKWLGALIPEHRLPFYASDEELRELLGDGAVLCRVADTLVPGSVEVCIFCYENFWVMLMCML